MNIVSWSYIQTCGGYLIMLGIDIYIYIFEMIPKLHKLITNKIDWHKYNN